MHWRRVASGIMTMIDTHTKYYWISFRLSVCAYNLTMWSNCGSLRHVLSVGIWTLQVGHSRLHLCKLSLMHLPQKRWLHSGLTSVSEQGSKQTGHSNSSWRSFLRDSRTEDNVNIMMIEQNWRCWQLVICHVEFGWWCVMSPVRVGGAAVGV